MVNTKNDIPEDDDDDPFGTPISEFVTFHDLKGRHVIFHAETLRNRVPGTNDEPIEALFGRMVALSGEVTEKITEIPFVIEDFRMTGKSVIPTVKSVYRVAGNTLGGKDDEYDLVPKDARKPLVPGKIGTQKSKHPQPMWVWQDADEDTMKLARDFIKANPEFLSPFN